MKISIKYIVVLLLVIGNSCKRSLSPEEKERYTKQGREIVQNTFEILSGHLLTQMKDGGPKQAIPYCNMEAMGITDMVSEQHDVIIKRTSHKIRNKKNAPTSEELNIISTYLERILLGKEFQAIVEMGSDGNAHFYAPIVLNEKCLACHGEVGKDISNEIDAILKSYYPNDQAIGFKSGELRGIWSVTFKN